MRHAMVALAALLLGCAGSSSPAPSEPATVEVAQAEVPEREQPDQDEEEEPVPAKAPAASALPDCKHEPQTADLAEAKKQFAIGVQLVNETLYAEASAAFSRAYQLSCKPAVLFNLGTARELSGDTSGAIAAFERYIEVEPAGPRVAELRERVARLRAKSP
jgi:hypothetical protein